MFQYIIPPIVACFLAQALKIVLPLLEGKPPRWYKFFETGGMPSSHSAMVMALLTVVALNNGVSSSLFGVAMVFALIVMYDASGVRQSVGKHAKVLNQLVAHLKSNSKIEFDNAILDKNLKESLGHTLLEVLGGALVGIIVALLIR
ncbi:MAG: divergent PAP2 family protein [Fusobacteria bacterium]|nr:divergent PAP2 family protein [Fusobacteriota bacterium]